MSYKFRLTAHSPTRGFFHSDEPSMSVDFGENRKLTVAPRDAATLDQATKYHFDCGGFPSAEMAYARGETLRQSLRLIIAILDLELVIPSEDKETGWIHDDVKKSIRDEGGELYNTRIGLSVYPDDGKHFEYIVSGEGFVKANDSKYVLNAVRGMWEADAQIEPKSIRALEILSLSAAETSPTTKFLLTYLALEQLISRSARGDAAREVLDQMRALVNESTLPADEKKSMLGSLSNLGYESFSSALSGYLATIKDPPPIDGIPLPQLVPRAVSLRNKIAHSAASIDAMEVRVITKALRMFVISTIWTANRLPPLSIDQPADRIRINKMEIRVL